MIGRDDEVALLAELVEAARAGRGRCLVLLGEAGIGKTTLLDAAADLGADLHVVRMVGVQAERDLPFAGLHSLVARLAAPGLDPLPAPQREALDWVLRLTSGEPPSRLLLGTAVLSLLAAQPPTLVLVDDLQWVDMPSADAITFACRRMLAEPVGIVLAARTGSGRIGDPDDVAAVAGLPSALVSGIADAAAMLPDVAPEVARRLADATAHNPLAMVEAAAGLSEEERSGLAPLATLPATNAETVFAVRLEDLDPLTRAAVRVVALAGRSPLDVQVRALAAVGATRAHVDVLEERGLSQAAFPPRWRHPLARSAAGRGSPRELRTAHRALADAWGDATAPARAWHLAAASDGVDARAAAALVAVARDDDRRGASAEAADAWEAAAVLTADAAERATFTERAARAALQAGATHRSAGLLDRALQRQPGAESAARLLWLRGRIQHTLGDPMRALEFFLQAQDLSTERDVQVWCCAEGVYAAMYAARPDQVDRMADLLDHHHDPADAVHVFLREHARGAAAALSGRTAEVRPHMDRARLLLAEGILDRAPELLLWAVNLELFDPVAPALTADLRDSVDGLRRRGDLTWLPRVLHLAAARCDMAGDWSEAESLIEEAELLSRMSGQVTQLQEALLGLSERAAVRGDTAALALRAAELEQLGARTGVSWLDAHLARLSGVAALTLGDTSSAAEALRHAVASVPDLLPLVVGAVLRVEGPEAARAELHRWEGAAEQHRAMASAVIDDAAALAGLAGDHPEPFEQAVLLLWAGERLRREGSRRRARETLRRAGALFDRLQATAWTVRVDEELRASGATLRHGGQGDRLTPSELRVATLVAQGLSNKEVATTLFLSPKTVEFHLGAAFRKLGVRNRTALAQALPR